MKLEDLDTKALAIQIGGWVTLVSHLPEERGERLRTLRSLGHTLVQTGESLRTLDGAHVMSMHEVEAFVCPGCHQPLPKSLQTSSGYCLACSGRT